MNPVVWSGHSSSADICQILVSDLTCKHTFSYVLEFFS